VFVIIGRSPLGLLVLLNAVVVSALVLLLATNTPMVRPTRCKPVSAMLHLNLLLKSAVTLLLVLPSTGSLVTGVNVLLVVVLVLNTVKSSAITWPLLVLTQATLSQLLITNAKVSNVPLTANHAPTYKLVLLLTV